MELDVCRAADTGTLVVSHDPPRHAEGALTLDAALSFLSRTHLELFVEIKQEGLAPAVIDTLVSHKVAERSVVFAFAEVARSFPWRDVRPARLGVIVMYPWQLDRTVREFAPDVLLLGWDDRTLDADGVSRLVVAVLAGAARAAAIGCPSWRGSCSAAATFAGSRGSMSTRRSPTSIASATRAHERFLRARMSMMPAMLRGSVPGA